jgi:hypothetical protein
MDFLRLFPKHLRMVKINIDLICETMRMSAAILDGIH